MSLSKSAMLSAVSALAILAATTVSPAGAAGSESFHLVKPQGKWKVGTVDAPEGVSYCAMVNQFDKETVLAISRNADGQGSIAIDFHKNFFTAGSEYDISLQVDDAAARKFSGHASSAHSVVVQLEHDNKFYDSLTQDGNLEVGTAAVDAIFALRKFSDSYVALLDCAGGLHQGPKTAAVPVPAVEKTPLAQNTPAVPDTLNNSSEPEETTGKSIRETMAAKASQESQLAQQRQKVAALESKRNEQQKVQDTLKLAVEKKDKEIAQIRDAQKEQDLLHAEEISRKESELAQHVAELQKDRDALKEQMESVKKSVQDAAAAVQENKKIKETLAAKEAQLAEAVKQQAQKPAEMAAALSAAQAGYQAKLATAEADREAVKKKFDTVVAENVPLKASVEKAQKDLADSKAHISELEGHLALLIQQKNELSTKVEAQTVQTKLLKEALTTKEQELVSTKTALTGGSQKLEDAQKELKNLVVERATVVDQLQAEIAEKAKQYDTIQKKLEENNKTLPLTFKMAADLAAKKENEARLEQQLAEAEAQRAAAAEAAATAQAALAEVENRQAQKVASADLEREEINQRLGTIAAELKARKAYLDKKAEEQNLEEARLKARRRELAGLQTGLQKKIVAANDLPDLSPPAAALALAGNYPILDDVLAAEIAPFAGGDRFSADRGGPVPLSAGGTEESAEEFLDRIMSYHRPGGAPAKITPPAVQPVIQKIERPEVIQKPVLPPEPVLWDKPAVSAGEKVTLEALLNNSGIAISNFVPVEENPGNIVSKWTSGTIRGMYDQSAATGDFNTQVSRYIDRYRQDCSGGILDAHIPSSETSKIGTMVIADIQCDMPSNTYAASFLFLRNDSGFIALLHTGYPSEKAEVRRIRDAIVQTLKASGGFSAPQSISQNTPRSNVDHEPRINDEPRRLINTSRALGDVPSPLPYYVPGPASRSVLVPAAAPPGKMDEPETVIIQ